MKGRSRARRREQHKSYYAQTAFKYKRRKWTDTEDRMVLAHAIPDRELSEVIMRSMKSISNRRWRLKRRPEEEGADKTKEKGR